LRYARFQRAVVSHTLEACVANMTTILLSPSDESSFLKELEQFGVRVIIWPEFRTGAPEKCFALDEAIENLFGYDWLVLKNERAADSFLQRFQSSHQLNELDDLKTLAIGEATSETLVHSQIHVDVALDRFSSANIFGALAGYAGDLNGLTLLLPSAGLNCESFEQQLTEAGARVDNVTAYRTTSDNQRLAQMMTLLVGGGIDGIIFTSSSALDEFSRLVDTDDLPRVLAGVAIICGDPETAQAAHEFGLSVDTTMLNPLSADVLTKLINAHRFD
jgi:uroporphyrinogen III methyltransferase / synthase